MAEVACPRCGAAVEEMDGPVHAYVPSAPGCWAAFGALRADETLRFPQSETNFLVVDAYMAATVWDSWREHHPTIRAALDAAIDYVGIRAPGGGSSARRARTERR